MKAWQETWEAWPGAWVSLEGGSEPILEAGRFYEDGTRLTLHSPEKYDERAELAAAAPEMVRVLLRVEWNSLSPRFDSHCPCCDRFEHRDGCALDAALTKAGFPDQASRDAARKAIGR